MDYRDKIVQILEVAGPVVPSQLKKQIGKDTLFVSAMLSEMKSKGLLKISHLKTGSSPLYYLPGQEEQLIRFIPTLNEKDRKTAELIQEKKILRDSEQQPLTRVSLRELKDFAHPLQVQYGETTETFWKWFLLPDADAEQFIKELLTPQEKNVEAPKPIKEKPKATVKPAKPKAEPKKEPVKEEKPKKTFVDTTESDSFASQLQTYFKKNNITVIEKKIVKKKSDIDYIVEVPSAVGTLTYYCKARNKKRIADADLSHAFVQGQLKKLPVLFLHPGQLTKKAKEFLPTLKGIAVNTIE